MTEHYHGGHAFSILGLAEEPSYQWSDTHHAKEVMGNGGAGDAHGTRAFAQSVINPHDSGETLERS
jgi:hypothetical protein